MKRLLALAVIGASLAAALPAFAQSAPTARPDMRFCGGSERGNYYRIVGPSLQTQMGDQFNISLKPTNGTPDILDGLANPNRTDAAACDVGAAQLDGLLEVRDMARVQFITRLYDEYAHLICTRQSGITRVSQLKNSQHIIAIGARTSGSAVMWRSLVRAAPEYGTVRTRPMTSSEAVGAMLERGEVSCLLMVSGLNSEDVTAVGQRGNGQMRLVDFDDRAFSRRMVTIGNRQESLYRQAQIPGGAYPQLNGSGWVSSGAIDTIAVSAVLVASMDWVRATRQAMGETRFARGFYEGIDFAKPDIAAAVARRR